MLNPQVMSQVVMHVSIFSCDALMKSCFLFSQNYILSQQQQQAMDVAEELVQMKQE